tara:strand:+ start:1811 stop:2002 length:192 start_codon:yes stop_codon:yes gene_type:complete
VRPFGLPEEQPEEYGEEEEVVVLTVVLTRVLREEQPVLGHGEADLLKLPVVEAQWRIGEPVRV